MAAPSRSIAVLLLAALLVGLGHIALLPPFEGFDETAHYSYIQQIAETGRWPRRGDKLSQDVARYLEAAPTTENMHGRWTYPSFFAAGHEIIEAGRQAIQSPPPAPRLWAPGHEANWQAQHPPLYYALLAPAYLVSKSWSLGAQLFFLRALSYLFAFAGLCIVAIAVLRQGEQKRSWNVLALGLWPAIFPMWFPEMARLGNDSLVTVFAALTFLLMYRVVREPAAPRDDVLLGTALGLAALTKATFLPVAAAALLFLAIRTVKAWRTDLFSTRLRGLLITGSLTAAIGGWWYAMQLFATGSVIGSNDLINMQESGGVIAGLAKNLTLTTVLRSPWDLATSFLWGGTWSFVLPPRLALAPLAVMGAVIAYGCWRYLRAHGVRAIDAFTFLALALFLAALVYHSVVFISLTGNVSPAWYLHSLAPILAPLVGYGIIGAMGIGRLRGVATGLFLYPLVFLPAATALAVLYFAGCAPLLEGRRYFSRSSAASCIGDYPRMLENLAVLAYPHTGLALFALGWVLLVIGTVMALRSFRAADYSTASIR